MNENYFIDRNGRAIRVGDRVATPSGNETVLGLNFHGGDSFPVVRIGESSWQRCGDVEVIDPGERGAGEGVQFSDEEERRLSNAFPGIQRHAKPDPDETIARDAQKRIDALEERVKGLEHPVFVVPSVFSPEPHPMVRWGRRDTTTQDLTAAQIKRQANYRPGPPESDG